MKKLFSLFSIAIAMMACAKPAQVAGDQERLWYDAPAGRWLEALPLGNGQMAAMVFGGWPRWCSAASPTRPSS